MKKYVCMAVLILVVISFLSVPITGQATVVSGGNWYLENGVLYITGNLGDFRVASSSSDYITTSDFEELEITKQVESVVVSEGVTIIGALTFFDMTRMRSISLPSTLREIHSEAFWDCNSLTSITIPENVTIIGPNAFSGCYNLKTVIFEGDAPTVTGYSYWYSYYPPSSSAYPFTGFMDGYYSSDKNWTTAKMGALGYRITWHDVTKVASGNCGSGVSWSYDIHHVLKITGSEEIAAYNSGDEAPWHEYNDEITTVIVGNGITGIPSHTFEGMTHLQSVSLPSTLSSISCNAFNNCEELTSITIPASVTAFEANQYFDGCDALTNLYYIGTETEWQQIANYQDCQKTAGELNYHYLVYHEAKASTCAEAGHDSYYAFDGTENTAIFSASKARLSGIPYLDQPDHTLEKQDAVAATCTAEGTEEYWSCSTCGKMFSDGNATTEINSPVQIPLAAHQLTTHEIVEATCTATGTEAYWSCDNCNKLFSDENGQNLIDTPVVIPITHHLTAHNAIDATCTASGTEAYWSCDNCGKLFSDEGTTTEIQTPVTISALGHDLVNHAAQSPTCTAIGWDAYETCNRCDYTTYEEKDALGHDIVNHAAKLPTCTEIGWDAYQTCSRCDYSTYAEITALGHDLEHHDGQAATCTADGWEAYDTCKREGCSYSTYTKIDALGHKLANHAAQEPTCTEVGWDAYQTCSRCDYSTYAEIAALGHDLEDHAAQAPTCTEAGWEAYQTCSRCDYTTKAEIAALEHEWNYSYTWNEDNTACTAERECTRNGCGSKDTEEGQIYSEYVPANCSESAKQVYTASFINDFFETQTKTVLLDDTDPGRHAWGAPTYTWSADYSTCTAIHVCMRNSAHQESETVKSEIVTNKPATCTMPGLISYTAQFTIADFGKANYDETVPASGHTPIKDPGTEATCISSGLTDGSHCSVCGLQLVERKNIPPLGHQVMVDPAVAPTTTSTGLTEGQHCGRCGAILLPQQTVAKLPASPNYDKVEAFVARCYQVILGRNPDAAGLSSWAQALKSGQAQASQIIDGFVNSPEFLNKHLSNGDAVEVLYKAMLGRGSDAAGKAAWTAALDAGNPFAVVINGFCGSTEFRNLCAEYGIQPGSVAVGNVIPSAPNQPVVTGDITKIKAFVTRCYQVILSRDPDGSGLDSWAQALATGQAQASKIIDGFVNSPEFLNKHLSNGDAVEVLYKAMLGRGSDPAGKQAWTAALDAGQPFAVIINGFCGSTEFTNLCASYGITPGSVTVKGVKHRNEGIAPEDANAVSAPVAKGGYNSEYINEEKVREFVIHCYRSVLGRDGDEQGIANYMAAIMDGIKSPRQVAHEFVFSPEFQANLPGNEDFIRILYRLYLNREADGDGLASWVAQLEAGAGLEEIVNGFASSQEFRNIVDTMR